MVVPAYALFTAARESGANRPPADRAASSRLLVRELEVEDVEVLGDAGGLGRVGDDGAAVLVSPKVGPAAREPEGRHDVTSREHSRARPRGARRRALGALLI